MDDNDNPFGVAPPHDPAVDRAKERREAEAKMRKGLAEGAKGQGKQPDKREEAGKTEQRVPPRVGRAARMAEARHFDWRAVIGLRKQAAREAAAKKPVAAVAKPPPVMEKFEVRGNVTAAHKAAEPPGLWQRPPPPEKLKNMRDALVTNREKQQPTERRRWQPHHFDRQAVGQKRKQDALAHAEALAEAAVVFGAPAAGVNPQLLANAQNGRLIMDHIDARRRSRYTPKHYDWRSAMHHYTRENHVRAHYDWRAAQQHRAGLILKHIEIFEPGFED
jgi:hypothetical protein